MAKTFYLIDGHAHIYRAFYAVDSSLTAPDGRPTNAALGFTRILLDIIRKHKPDYLTVVFDAPGRTFRHERYAAYKATRKPTPPELISQVPMIQEIVRAYRIPVFMLDGFEADDVLGTLAHKAEAFDLDVVLVTGDKDCGQLLTDRVRLYDAKNGRFTGRDDFIRKKGLNPEQLTDLMGLWGDSSDNIPGVPGIGEKIGVQLIKKYGSLENLLEHADEIKGKRGQVLRDNIEQAKLSKELAAIDINAPVTLDLEACRLHEPDREKLIGIFEDLGFKSLLYQIQDDVRGGSRAPTRKASDYVLVDTGEKFSSFIRALEDEKHFAIDTETTGLDPMNCELVGISVSWAENSGYYLPFSGPEGAATLGREELERMRRILADPEITKCGQNIKYDALVLRRAGIELNGIVFDSLLASNLLEGNFGAHNIDALAMRYLDIKTTPISDLIGSGKNQLSMAAVDTGTVCDYACEDADIALRLENVLRQELQKSPETAKLLNELELPLSLVLTEMQYTGIRVDCALLARQSDELAVILEALTAEIHAMAGREFNIASPKQLAAILFEEMNLPVLHRTKTGPSTNESTLLELAAMGHELPRRILDYRTYAKLKNTYVDTLPKLVNRKTGRIHTTFSQTVTATGRLSSRDPNLQNIPVRTAEGKAIRAAFVPEQGWRMLAADYSQIELRILAHYCRDEVLLQAFGEGIDIHAAVAAQLYHVSPDQVTSSQRSSAKAVNFGIIYGQTPHGLSQSTGMSVPEARDFIDAYFARFPRIRDFIDATVAAAESDLCVRTMLGRRRRIPDLKSHNKMKRARAEREAVNTVIQGSAADLVKTAMVRLHECMRKSTPRSRMLLQIHDELVFEAPPSELQTLQDIVREEMEGALPLSVPLKVDMGTGDNWLEVK